jgi:hypothetical protein
LAKNKRGQTQYRSLKDFYGIFLFDIHLTIFFFDGYCLVLRLTTLAFDLPVGGGNLTRATSLTIFCHQ